MKALLKFGTTEERALDLVEICKKKGYVLRHKNHGEPLTELIIKEGGFKVNFGGYGSYSRLGLGNNFGSKWEVSGLEAPPGKTFMEVDVCFGADIDPEEEKVITEYIKKRGGSVSTTGDGDCDLCIVSTGEAGEQSLLETIGRIIEGGKGFIVISVEEFLAVIPAVKKGMTGNAPAKRLNDDLRATLKKLQERDFALINQVLESLKGRDEDIDILVQDVFVDPKTGELERGPKFKGSGPAMRYLDVALMGLLSIATDRSTAGQLRQSIRKLRLGISRFPVLYGFTGLEILEVVIDRIEDEGTIYNLENLAVLGELPSLRSISLTNEENGSGTPTIRIKSLAGLKAPQLKEFCARDVGLIDLSALSYSESLESVDLSWNSDLTNIEFLRGASSLRSLMLDGTSVSSLEALKECVEIRELSLNSCGHLKSLRGLKCHWLEALELCGLNLETLRGLEPLNSLRSLRLDSLDHISSLDPLSALINLQYLEISGLTAIRALPDMSALQALREVSIRGCNQLVDITSLSAARLLDSVNIGHCKILRQAPVEWPSTLTSLKLYETSLTEIGLCPESLSELLIHNNPKLLSIEGLAACKEIDASSYSLDLSGCFSLKSLKGLNVESLAEIRIPETMTDLDRLSNYPGINIVVIAGSGKQKGYNTVVEDIPSGIGNALAKLNITTLAIRTDWDAVLKRISGIGLVTSLKILDLSDCDVRDITAIAGLEKLELLKVQPRTELSKKLGKATFNTKGQIDKLRLRILAGL